MRTSKLGIDLIKYFEGLHDGDLKQIGLQPKLCPANIWTEGWGRAMRDDKGNFIKGIANKELAYSRISIHSEEEADKALIEDLVPREFLVAQKLKIEVPQNVFDMLVSHVYNTGGSDTLFKMVNNKADLNKIAEWNNTHYIRGGGKVLKGLINRRKAESKLLLANV
jgi:lysozyme